MYYTFATKSGMSPIYGLKLHDGDYHVLPTFQAVQLARV
jgi:hypothetical protein